MTKKKYPKSVLPYLDQDYVDKLSEFDKAWLEEFNLAYYLGEHDGDKTGEERKRLAKRDLMNTHKSPHSAPKLKAPNRYYTKADYTASCIVSFADALIDSIDLETAAKIIPIGRRKKSDF